MISRWTLALLATIATATCCATSTTSNQVAADLAGASPNCAIERESRLVLGRASLGLVRSLIGRAEEDLDDAAREILRATHRVEATTFHVGSACALPDRASSLRGRLASEGWHAVVSDVEQGGELSLVLTRQGTGGAISSLLVITLDGDELEVVRLDGEIERVLVAAVAHAPSTVLGLASDGT